jgi:hypothetical protein
MHGAMKVVLPLPCFLLLFMLAAICKNSDSDAITIQANTEYKKRCHASGVADINIMVNFTRFTKSIHAWQAPPSPQPGVGGACLYIGNVSYRMQLI